MPRPIVILYRDVHTVSEPVKLSFQSFFEGKGLVVEIYDDPASFLENSKLFFPSSQVDAEHPWYVIGTQFGLGKPLGDDVVRKLLDKGVCANHIARISVMEGNRRSYIYLDWCDFEGTWQAVYDQLQNQ